MAQTGDLVMYHGKKRVVVGVGLVIVFMKILCIVENTSPIRADTVLVYGVNLMRRVKGIKNEYTYNDGRAAARWKKHVV